ncbi:MAG: biotin transporter BioY [Pseudohongiellaceae bacterium]
MTHTLLRRTLVSLLAAALIAMSAQLSFPLPGTDIPQTAQTIAVLVVGSLLGPLWGPIAVLLYLLAGVIGLPVYSDGASGWATLSGGSAGYFVGFIAAAALSGVLRRTAKRELLWLLSLQMLAAHLVILAAGWLWLALSMAMLDAFFTGVTPFIYGGIVKSVLCAAIVLAASRIPAREPAWFGSR